MEICASTGYGQRFHLQAVREHPLSALALAEAYKEAGLPDGLFNVVQGFGDVGAALVNHRMTAKVSLTGSVPTGKRIMSQAGEHLKHVTMELGGKSPIIVLMMQISTALLAVRCSATSIRPVRSAPTVRAFSFIRMFAKHLSSVWLNAPAKSALVIPG